MGIHLCSTFYHLKGTALSRSLKVSLPTPNKCFSGFIDRPLLMQMCPQGPILGPVLSGVFNLFPRVYANTYINDFQISLCDTTLWRYLHTFLCLTDPHSSKQTHYLPLSPNLLFLSSVFPISVTDWPEATLFNA